MDINQSTGSFLRSNADLPFGGYHHDRRMTFEIACTNKKAMKVQAKMNVNEPLNLEAFQHSCNAMTNEAQTEMFLKYEKNQKVRHIRRGAPTLYSNFVVSFGTHILRWNVSAGVFKMMKKCLVGKIRSLCIRKKFEGRPTYRGISSTFIATKCETRPLEEEELATAHSHCCVFSFASPCFTIEGADIDDRLNLWEDRQIAISLSNWIVLLTSRMIMYDRLNNIKAPISREEVLKESRDNRIFVDAGLRSTVLMTIPSPTKIVDIPEFLTGIRLEEDLMSITEFTNISPEERRQQQLEIETILDAEENADGSSLWEETSSLATQTPPTL